VSVLLDVSYHTRDNIINYSKSLPFVSTVPSVGISCLMSGLTGTESVAAAYGKVP
jgi:hypothetical protein